MVAGDWNVPSPLPSKIVIQPKEQQAAPLTTSSFPSLLRSPTTLSPRLCGKETGGNGVNVPSPLPSRTVYWFRPHCSKSSFPSPLKSAVREGQPSPPLRSVRAKPTAETGFVVSKIRGCEFGLPGFLTVIAAVPAAMTFEAGTVAVNCRSESLALGVPNPVARGSCKNLDKTYPDRETKLILVTIKEKLRGSRCCKSRESVSLGDCGTPKLWSRQWARSRNSWWEQLY